TERLVITMMMKNTAPIRHTLTAALAASLLLASCAMAQQPATLLNDPASNPKTLGWMQGSPPPAAKIIRFTDPDYFAFPTLRWTACHFRELMPSTSVNNGTEGARK